MRLNDFIVYDLVERGSELHPGSLAIIDGERRINYADFKTLVDFLANGLKLQGLIKGDRIGVVAQNSLELLALFFASSCIGTMVVPINTRLTEEEMEWIFKDVSPTLIFADDNFRERLNKTASSLTGLKGLFSLGGASHTFQGFDSLLVQGQVSREIECGSQDGLAILYTAATFGRPKGAILTNGNFISSNLLLMSSLQLSSKDIYLDTLPFYHIAGLGSSLAVFHSGGINILMAKFEPERALEWIEKEKVSLFTTFPPILANLLDCHEKTSTNISSLRYLIGLEHLDNINRLREKSKAKFFVGYGQTETTGLITVAPFDERLGSAGKPTPLARIKLFDDYDEDVPRGSPGEIAVCGPLVFKGYWNLREDNEYTFRGGWHHTGDVGRLDADGYLWYVKRKAEKELIKPGGENVYPAEVEKTILQFPGIKEVVVIGVPHPKWGEGIKAVCVLEQGFAVTQQEIIDFVAGKIARYKKPHFVQFVSFLPKDETGFIDREKIRTIYGVN